MKLCQKTSVPNPTKLRLLDDDRTERVLGVSWKFDLDEFHFVVSLPWKPRTKRGVLATMNSVFDPLGFVTPVVLGAKLIYRSLCVKDLDWDEQFSDEDLQKWKKWMQSLTYLKAVSVPRWLGLQSSKNGVACQLHFFADASSLAYGAVCYIRAVDLEGNKTCSFVMSKSYLVPKDEISSPRLELPAAVTAVKMDKMRTELHVSLRPCVFWTDSSIVLQSIMNDRKHFPLFVSRRLAFTTKHSCTANWNHVSSSLNPADFLSRGARVDHLDKNNIWFRGPDFLEKSPSEWPSRFKKKELSAKEITSVDKSSVKVFSVVNEEAAPIDKLISSFSSWYEKSYRLAFEI